MLSNRLAFAALAVACIAAAAGGGYLASRQNAVPAPASAQVTTPQPAPAAAPATAAPDASAPAARPVQETEAVVGDTKSPAASEPAKAASRRGETAREPQPAAKSARANAKQPPPLTSTWPSGASAQQPAPAPNPTAPPADAPKAEEHAAPTPAPAPEPQKQFEDLVVSRDSVIGLQTDTRISSETARVEDRVEARVTRDVKVADRVAIPAGARAVGAVTLVERGGKFKERARLGIRFHTLVLADGTRLPINTETIFREGEAPTTSSTAKIGGGAVGGAIIGAILGGAKGAAIGATTGAGAGTAAVAAGDRSTVVLQPGTPLTVRLQQPVTVTIERD